MPKIFKIRYKETYERTYNVLASSEENAIEALDHDIHDGYVDGPDCCVDSEFSSAGAFTATDETPFDVDGRIE